MGFFTTGKRLKRHRAVVIDVGPTKRFKLESTPSLIEEVNDPTPEPEIPLSVLERIPLELLHEIAIHAGFNNLHMTSKRLFERLKPSRALVVRMIQQNCIHDLNDNAWPSEFSVDSEIQYVLDRDVFKYAFIAREVLVDVRFDTVWTREIIEHEQKRRHVLYQDWLNKKTLQRMVQRAEVDADEVARELARMAEVRFGEARGDNNNNDYNDNNVNDNNNENSNVANDSNDDAMLPVVVGDFDFHDRFYNVKKLHEIGPIVEYLAENKHLRYTKTDKIMTNLINAEIYDIHALEKLLSYTKDKYITTTNPLIALFSMRGDIKVANWIVDNFQDTNMINDSVLWEAAIREQDHDFLRFLTERGGVPTFEALKVMNGAGF